MNDTRISLTGPTCQDQMYGLSENAAVRTICSENIAGIVRILRTKTFLFCSDDSWNSWNSWNIRDIRKPRNSRNSRSSWQWRTELWDNSLCEPQSEFHVSYSQSQTEGLVTTALARQRYKLLCGYIFQQALRTILRLMAVRCKVHFGLSSSHLTYKDLYLL